MSFSLQALSQRWQAWSGQLNPREKLGLQLAAGVIGLALLWLLAVQPVIRTWKQVPPQIAEAEAQWLDMQRLATEAKELKNISPVNPAQAAQALQAATERLGSAGRLTLLGERATLQLTQASPEQLRNWLQEAREGARARPLEMQLTRSDAGLSGQLVLSLPGSV